MNNDFCTMGCNPPQQPICKKGEYWNNDTKKCEVNNSSINSLFLSVIGIFIPLVGWKIGGTQGFIGGCFINLILNIVFFWAMGKGKYKIGDLLSTILILVGIWGVLSILLLIIVIIVVSLSHSIDHKLLTIIMIMGGSISSTIGGFSIGSLLFNK
jgi:hypothetical protein